MSWTAYALILAFAPVTSIFALMFVGYFIIVRLYLHVVPRIFAEKPLFIIPRGTKPADAEEVELTTQEGLKLKAAYLRHRGARRKGVIFFGLEFGANRWSCVDYVEPLLAAGYDVFTYEPRNQGESDKQPGYEPLQWVTDRDAADCRLALKYLANRPDADPHGIGVYGISKGGSAGIVAAAEEPAVKCVLTDGAFATISTMVPYMRYWFKIYNSHYLLHGLVRPWYYALFAYAAMRRISRERGVTYLEVEHSVARLSPRALLMIHGERDGYIKPCMARGLFDRAKEPKEFWLVKNAKHNQAIEVARDEYRKRVVDFFDTYLAAT